VHGRSRLEFLRLDHGHEEVGEEAQGDQSHDDVFHDGQWLEAAAETHVKRANDEEGDGDAEVDEVVHGEERLLSGSSVIPFSSADN
jgi:hypothetical protein